MPSKREPATSMADRLKARLASSVRPAALLGATFATIAVARAAAASAPFLTIITAGFLAFGLYFVIPFVVVAAGGTPTRRGIVDVPAWLAWAVAGGFAAFWVGAIAGRVLWIGWITAAAWILGVLVVTGIRHLSRRRRSA